MMLQMKASARSHGGRPGWAAAGTANATAAPHVATATTHIRFSTRPLYSENRDRDDEPERKLRGGDHQ